MDFFSLLYSWAVSLGLYSPELDDFLKDPSDGMNYLILFLVPLAVTLIALLIYYVIIDRASWTRWWKWAIAGAINALIIFVFSSQTVLQNQMDDLTATMTSDGQTENLVSEMDCWMFGVTNTILFIVIFFALSFVVRFFSTNNRYMPF